MWIASNADLSRFDGRKFKSYTDSTGLNSSRVRSLFFDSSDRLWVGTSKGINLLEKDSIYEFEYNDKFEHPSVRGIIEAENKSIFIGIWNGLYIYQGGKIDSIKTFENDEVGVVYCLKQDSKGNVWFGTHHGIEKYDGNKVEKFEMEGSSGQNIIESIEEDKDGNIWFATRRGDAFIYSGVEFENITTQNELSSNGLFSVFRDSNDIIWLGGGGLNKYYGEGFYHIGTEQGLII